MKLIQETIKNLKIILRSWTSLSLLVLGPLALILLIGYTLSNEMPHDIKLGLHSSGGLGKEIIQRFESVGTVYPYKELNSCFQDLKEQRVHMCLDIAQVNGPVIGNITTTPSAATIPSKAVLSFYFDDSNKKISKLLTANLNEIIGKKSSEVSLEATQTILDDIQEMVFYVNSKRDAVASAEQEMRNIRSALVTRQEKLQNLSSTFNPHYYRIKTLQQELHMQVEQLNASQDLLDNQISNMRTLLNVTLDLLEEKRSAAVDSVMRDPFNITAFSLNDGNITVLYREETEYETAYMYSLESLSFEDRLLLTTSLLDVAFNKFEKQVSVVDTTKTVTSQQLFDLLEQFDKGIEQLDAVKQLLDDELMFTTAAIEKIDVSIQAIDATVAALDDRLGGLSALDPSIADVLVNPFVKEYKALTEFRNIETLFPGLVVIIIVFITLLFANILALSEINSEAYFRNVISPVSSLLMPLGVFLSTVLLVVFQAIILFLIGQFWFDVHVFHYLGEAGIVVLLLIFVFTLIGMGLAYLIRAQEISVVTTTFVALGFYLFSSLVTPLELMPLLGARIAQFNPIVIGETLLRKLLLYEIPLSWSMDKILLLVLFVIVLGVASIILNKRLHDSQ